MLLSILIGIVGLFNTVGLYAQCDTQADFTFTINGCDVEFQPLSNGTGTMHTWSFRTTNTGFTSMSNHPIPLHTFGFATNPSRTVTHSVVISGVLYTCTKEISVECTSGCDDKVFGYDVVGCTVMFTAGNSGQNWHFGDGNTSTLSQPTHTYATSGDYIVSYIHPSGDTCQKTIRVRCDTASSCCTADFTAVATRNCSVLNLSLKAECMEAGAGIHIWTVVANQPNACITLANFSSNQPMQGMIQVTNINTCIVDSLIITHTYLCAGGAILVRTQTIALPPDGIFIGINQQTTELTDYNCVLPGSTYNGGCTVYSSGIIKQNKFFTFSNTDIRIHPGITGIDVQTKFGISTNTIVRGNLEPECQCLWRGIYVKANGQLGTNTAIIQDALYAVRAEEDSRVSLKNTQFLRNFVGFRATEGPFILSGFQENVFDGVGPLMELDNCPTPNGLSALNDVVVSGLPGLNCVQPVPYFKDEGFAGLYLDNIGSLILSPLPLNEQNIFRNLVVGIDATDTELDIQQNSRFSNIQPGTNYGTVLGGMAIRYTDKVNAGANGIRFIGNGQYAGGDPDIEDSFMGIYVNSGVIGTVSTGTRIDIGQSRIIGVHTGIVLADVCGPGTFIGTRSGHGHYRGIWHNHIIVDPILDNEDFVGAAAKAGILVSDFGVTQSAPEIWQNEIDVNEDSDCGSLGIRVNGLVLNQTAYQVLIDRNRVDLNRGTFGILVAEYEGARVTNNGNNGFPGAGVYINNPIPQRQCFAVSRDVSSGIVFRTGNYNTSTCNDVRSNVSNSWLHEVSQNPMGVFARNELEGGRFSAQFRGDCNTSIFACNNMIDYSENGLRYTVGAETGDQGTPFSMTRGNKWFNGNGVAVDAFIDDPVSTPGLSRYFVRNAPNETPTTNGIIGWFNVNVTSAPDCYLECPIVQSPPEFYNFEITTRDTMVANREITFNFYPEASLRLAQFHLLHKLLSCDTFEVVDNALMHEFVDGFLGTPVYKLVEATQSLVDAGKFTSDQEATAGNYMTGVNQLFFEIAVVDSLLKITVDTTIQAVYRLQLITLQTALSEVQTGFQELVNSKHEEFYDEAVEVLSAVNAIVPEHVFEVNTQTVLRAYLENLILGYQPEIGTLESLHAIASQCEYTGGPSVGNARSLYERFTGAILAESDCEGMFERDMKSQYQISQSIETVSIYPNPANDLVFIDLSKYDPENTYYLECINMFGQISLNRVLYNVKNQIQIQDLPNGIYNMRIFKNETPIGNKLISIQK